MTDKERAAKAVAEIGADDWYVGTARAQEIVLELIHQIRAERCADNVVVAFVDELTGGLSAQAEAKLLALLRK